MSPTVPVCRDGFAGGRGRVTRDADPAEVGECVLGAALTQGLDVVLPVRRARCPRDLEYRVAGEHDLASVRATSSRWSTFTARAVRSPCVHGRRRSRPCCLRCSSQRPLAVRVPFAQRGSRQSRVGIQPATGICELGVIAIAVLIVARTTIHRERQFVQWRTSATRAPPPRHGHVQPLHRTILEECWRPAFARYLQVRFSGLRRDLSRYLHDYNFDREHHGRITNGRRPADLVYGAPRWSPDEPHLSAQLESVPPRTSPPSKG